MSNTLPAMMRAVEISAPGGPEVLKISSALRDAGDQPTRFVFYYSGHGDADASGGRRLGAAGAFLAGAAAHAAEEAGPPGDAA